MLIRRPIDRYGAEFEHVEDEKRLVGDVRQPFVVVAAATDFEAETKPLGAGNGGGDVGFIRWGDDEEGFGVDDVLKRAFRMYARKTEAYEGLVLE
ncbi:hypothetical protein F3Y22_tig00117026pilonHSYRG00106 [Hibiscus syriacus]|uniref:Uncharacterized protein n=1 Tax=Hibiscus syriacus TaxID=106335 RepID=A0A6A2WBF5_HIBSY|nr:hypothetical protein F3Y22_tig00117026pilonHSYRG00106 [Hibiscus syriacus]